MNLEQEKWFHAKSIFVILSWIISSQNMLFVEEKVIKKFLTWQANKNKLYQPTKQHIFI